MTQKPRISATSIHLIMFSIFNNLSANLWKSKIIDFWLCAMRWYTKKDLDLVPSPPNHLKYFLKVLPLTVSINWPSFMSKRFTIPKIYLKLYTTYCASTPFRFYKNYVTETWASWFLTIRPKWPSNILKWSLIFPAKISLINSQILIESSCIVNLLTGFYMID